MKISIFVLSLLMISGCQKVFKKPGDELVKSDCEVCQKSPFYVNGKWIKP